MEHMALMDAINVAFLLGGTFYWWPMVGLDPIVHWKMGYGARLANLALGVPFEAFLGIAIMSQRAPIASMYTVSSTHAGGAVLWAATEVATFTGMVPIVLQWVRADDRAGRRADDQATRRRTAPARVLPIADVALADVALAGEPRAATSLLGEKVRPLFQPGNSTWEAMWRAKAGFVPSPRPETPAQSNGNQDREPADNP
jgi:hypothetical protein